MNVILALSNYLLEIRYVFYAEASEKGLKHIIRKYINGSMQYTRMVNGINI